MQIDPRFASFVPSNRGIAESSVALKGTKEREKLKEACSSNPSFWRRSGKK